MPASAPKNIALTGFMAVGKTHVGRKLARRLGWRFVDVDRAIERDEGRKVQEIFHRDGEARFRILEKQKLREVLARERQVIATGGGAVMDEENLALLKEKTLRVCVHPACTRASVTVSAGSAAGNGRCSTSRTAKSACGSS